LAVKYFVDDVLLKDGVGEIMDFEYIAYGNARGVPPKMTCQHGEEECKMNTYEECAKNQTRGNFKKYMPFANCLEQQKKTVTPDVVKECASKMNLDGDDIVSCLTDGRGDKLNTAAAKATPSHEGVPWVTYNGKVMKDYDYHPVLKKACDDWTGTKPPCCKNLEEAAQMCYNDQ